MATLSEVFSNIANAIRNKTGKTATMTPAEMVVEIGALSDTSTDTVTAAKMLSGTTAHDKSGTKVTGTIATATQATPSISVDSAGKITASATQTAGYVSAGTKSATKQLTTQAAKTVTPSASSQTAVASGVYTTGAITVAAIPSTYVKPTATKAATTYTPTTSNQTISAGTYCSGAQTIKGDANLVPENIASGVSIFGVEGMMEAGTGTKKITVNFSPVTDFSQGVYGAAGLIVNGQWVEHSGDQIELLNEYPVNTLTTIIGYMVIMPSVTSMNVTVNGNDILEQCGCMYMLDGGQNHTALYLLQEYEFNDGDILSVEFVP